MSSKNSTRRILCVIAALVFAAFVLVGCGDGSYGHKHTFDTTTWENDADTHWNPATCEHDSEKGNEAAHTYDGSTCTVCGYKKGTSAHEHTYDDTKWASDADYHWHPATCAHSNKMKDQAAHTFDPTTNICTVCGKEKEVGAHEHTYNTTEWVTTDAEYHWHAATCEHTDAVTDKAAHTYGEDSDACKVCGSTAHKHTYNTSRWVTTDVDYHWHPATCGHDNQSKDKAPHVFDEGGEFCTVCGAAFHEHTFDTAKRVNTDPNYHWYVATCEHTSVKGKLAPHVYKEGNNACVYCGYKNPNMSTTVEQPAVIKPFSNTYNTSYTPTLFSTSGLTSSVTNLGPGVNMVATSFKLNTNRGTTVYTIEVELDKANVVAGTKNNNAALEGLSAPYSQALAWESANPGGHVYSSLNADFFSGNNPVNAFVKDGVIVQDGHLDWSGIYDYTNTKSDVPASAPMLFGVKGTKAQVTSMIKYTGDPTTAAVKQQLVKAKLTYATHNKIEGVATEFDKLISNTDPTNQKVALYTSGTTSRLKDALVLKVDISGGTSRMKVLEKTVVTKRTDFTAVPGVYGYIIALESNTEGYEYYSLAEVGGYVILGEQSVKSPDGTWDGYETILGCRQALIIDGNIPSTVSKENTNGAQSKGIPRSAVGIKEGRVVIFAVEGLRYSGKSSSSSDPYGMNLPELAQFMKYYGIENGANFDGGGSTKLITKAAGGSAVTRVRSSDYGNSKVSGYARSVVNSILVVNRPSK